MFFIKEIIKETNKYVIHFKTGENEVKIIEFTPEEFKKMSNLIKQSILGKAIKVSENENVKSTLQEFKEGLKEEMFNEIADIRTSYDELNKNVKSFVEIQKNISSAKSGFEIQLEGLIKKIDNLNLLEETAVKKLTEGETKRNDSVEKILKKSNSKETEIQELVKSINKEMTDFKGLVKEIKSSKSEQDKQFQELSKNIETQRKAGEKQAQELVNNLNNSNKNQFNTFMEQAKKITPETKNGTTPKTSNSTTEKTRNGNSLKNGKQKTFIINPPKKPEVKEEPKKPEVKEESKKHSLIDLLKTSKVIYKKGE